MRGRANAFVQAGAAGDIRISGNYDKRGVYALLVVVVLLIATGVVVLWRLTGRDEAPVTPPAAISELRLKADCRSGWVVPDRGDAPIPVDVRRPADAVLGTGGEVVVTAQGRGDTSVVLQSARVEVLSRRPARTGIYLPSWCQAEMPPRFFRLDLAEAAPELVPVALEGEPAIFPFRVSGLEPEQFVITAFSPDEEVEWLLHLRWTSGATEGELVVDDRGTPFRTTGVGASRRFCLAEGGNRWQVPPC